MTRRLLGAAAALILIAGCQRETQPPVPEAWDADVDGVAAAGVVEADDALLADQTKIARESAAAAAAPAPAVEDRGDAEDPTPAGDTAALETEGNAPSADRPVDVPPPAPPRPGDEPPTAEPADEEPADEEPADEEPADEEPTADEPAEPADDEPADDEAAEPEADEPERVPGRPDTPRGDQPEDGDNWGF